MHSMCGCGFLLRPFFLLLFNSFLEILVGYFPKDAFNARDLTKCPEVNKIFGIDWELAPETRPCRRALTALQEMIFASTTIDTEINFPKIVTFRCGTKRCCFVFALRSSKNSLVREGSRAIAMLGFCVGSVFRGYDRSGTDTTV